MPLYSYRCKACGKTHENLHSMHEEIPTHATCVCGGSAYRQFTSPAFARFNEHFNHSLGRVVGSKGQFKTALYEAQETMTERLGFQQSYVEVPPDTGVTEEGMDKTHDAHKALGLST